MPRCKICKQRIKKDYDAEIKGGKKIKYHRTCKEGKGWDEARHKLGLI